MNRWNEIVALAREIDAALTGGAPIAPDKARRLAKMVLAGAEPPAETNGHGAEGGRAPESR